MKRSYIGILVLAASLVVGLGAAPAATHSEARGVTVRSATSSLGRIVVDAGGRTLYAFGKDSRNHSACSGACAANWPPLLATGKPRAGSGTKQSLLGVIRRVNGTRQVTYAGHPLYRFVKDTGAGQTNGQGISAFGASWYVVAPGGKKIEQGESDPGYPRQPGA